MKIKTKTKVVHPEPFKYKRTDRDNKILFDDRKRDVRSYTVEGYNHKTCYICWKSKETGEFVECEICSRGWHCNCFKSKNVCSCHKCLKENCENKPGFSCKFCFLSYCEDHGKEFFELKNLCKVCFEISINMSETVCFFTGKKNFQKT